MKKSKEKFNFNEYERIYYLKYYIVYVPNIN